ncbi:MAG: hypothetical protein K6E96_04425 [Bacteroidales bacterium]|nr:hypothetical protein [Bacteroidales bacterium]
MKTKKHKSGIIAKAAVLLALFLTSTPAATAQEYIKKVDGIYSDTSIIREYKEDVRIIYSQQGDDKQFIKVTESGTTAPLLVLNDDIFVSDFEIMEDTLYFCGVRYFNQLYAFLGYIDLTSFPSTFYGNHFPDMGAFYKMEVFRSRNGGEKHIVMTGDAVNRGSCVVDVRMPTSGSWSYYFSPADSSWAIFDDVAVTDTRVLASLRTSTQNGYVYYFNHPAMNNSFLISPAFKMHLGGGIISPIVLENCQSNYYALACRRLHDKLSYIIEVRAYHDNGFYRGRYIAGSQTYQFPIDLKYNTDKRELDMLTNEIAQNPIHRIYHIDSTGLFLCRTMWFATPRVFSLDYLATDPNHFVASGWGDDRELWFYKYSPSIRGVCSDTIQPISWEADRKESEKSFVSWCTLFNKDAIPLSKTVGEKDIKIKCYSDKKEDDEQ